MIYIIDSRNSLKDDGVRVTGHSCCLKRIANYSVLYSVWRTKK